MFTSHSPRVQFLVAQRNLSEEYASLQSTIKVDLLGAQWRAVGEGSRILASWRDLNSQRLLSDRPWKELAQSFCVVSGDTGCSCDAAVVVGGGKPRDRS